MKNLAGGHPDHQGANRIQTCGEMKSLKLTLSCAVLMAVAQNSIAQTYHSDVILNGEQTLKVDGNLSIKQYGSGFGGDLDVIGEAKLATGYVDLTGLPTGVTGGVYGPIHLSGLNKITQFFFSKTGTQATGDFLVPIGKFANGGGPIEVSIFPQGTDWITGAAYYTLGSTSYGSYNQNGQVTALKHLAFGGGCNAKLLAFAAHGYTHLYLDFDGRTSLANQTVTFQANVQVRSVGNVQPSASVMYPISSALPLRVLHSIQVPYIGQTGGNLDVSTTKISTDKTLLEGQVSLAEPQGDISMGVYGN